MLLRDLETLTLDPPKPRYQLRHGPISLALIAYKFKTSQPMDDPRESCTKGESADPLEGSCRLCHGPEGKPLEQPKTEMSSDKEAFEG